MTSQDDRNDTMASPVAPVAAVQAAYPRVSRDSLTSLWADS